ncbi:MAG: OadG family protein [Firmicutes bacterium]|nr:OadG family protein [Bacillota bacterium]MCM1401010.1 OadG family protein [Bacteroides sp.]MCM1476537.1 OadG family protein [Bacteroides sp.]
MKQKILTLLLIVAFCGATVAAQSRRNLRINEVMVVNDSNYVDDYGHHNAWIELFNTTHAPLNIASVFITNNPATLNPELTVKQRKALMYPVPLGDVQTKLPKRQHVVFWADGKPTLGTFHTNFTLTPGRENWVAVFDADGKTLIDSVTIPAALGANQSYARIADGIDMDKNGHALGAAAWEIRNDSEGRPVTPSSNNKIRETNDKIDMFAQQDKNGFAMAIMAMGIVFSALLLLCVCFYIISKIGERVLQHNKAASKGTKRSELPVEERKGHDSGEEIAAIVMALHEHLDAHDRENTVLTINKVKRTYSPWSSKIYNLRQMPQR